MERKQYDQYRFNRNDWLEYIVRILIKGAVICYLFYDSYKACLLLIPFAIVDYQRMKKRRLEEQKKLAF